MYPKVIKFKFDEDARKFVGVMFILALLMFLFYYIWLRVTGDDISAWEIGIRCCEIFTTAVPPALPLCMSIGTQFSLNRLKKKKIFCINPSKVNMAGRVKVCCFDKTGT